MHFGEAIRIQADVVFGLRQQIWKSSGGVDLQALMPTSIAWCQKRAGPKGTQGL